MKNDEIRVGGEYLVKTDRYSSVVVKVTAQIYEGEAGYRGPRTKFRVERASNGQAMGERTAKALHPITAGEESR